MLPLASTSSRMRAPPSRPGEKCTTFCGAPSSNTCTSLTVRSVTGRPLFETALAESNDHARVRLEARDLAGERTRLCQRQAPGEDSQGGTRADFCGMYHGDASIDPGKQAAERRGHWRL